MTTTKETPQTKLLNLIDGIVLSIDSTLLETSNLTLKGQKHYNAWLEQEKICFTEFVKFGYCHNEITEQEIRKYVLEDLCTLQERDCYTNLAQMKIQEKNNSKVFSALHTMTPICKKVDFEAMADNWKNLVQETADSLHSYFELSKHINKDKRDTVLIDLFKDEVMTGKKPYNTIICPAPLSIEENDALVSTYQTAFLEGLQYNNSRLPQTRTHLVALRDYIKDAKGNIFDEINTHCHKEINRWINKLPTPSKGSIYVDSHRSGELSILVNNYKRAYKNTLAFKREQDVHFYSEALSQGNKQRTYPLTGGNSLPYSGYYPR